MICERCRRPIYRDEIPVQDGGGVRFLYRDEATERVSCPQGGEHVPSK